MPAAGIAFPRFAAQPRPRDLNPVPSGSDSSPFGVRAGVLKIVKVIFVAGRARKLSGSFLALVIRAAAAGQSPLTIPGV